MRAQAHIIAAVLVVVLTVFAPDASLTMALNGLGLSGSDSSSSAGASSDSDETEASELAALNGLRSPGAVTVTPPLDYEDH